MNELIIDKLKEIKQLRNNIKLDDLEYTTKRGKNDGFSKYSLPIFLKDIYEENLSIEDAGKEQRNLLNKLSGENKSKIPVEKRYFLNNIGLFFSASRKIFNSFESKMFLIKNLDKIPAPDPTHNPTAFDTPKPTKVQTKKSKHRISLLKFHENFVNRIKNDE